jgi:hypothetical protein
MQAHTHTHTHTHTQHAFPWMRLLPTRYVYGESYYLVVLPGIFTLMLAVVYFVFGRPGGYFLPHHHLAPHSVLTGSHEVTPSASHSTTQRHIASLPRYKALIADADLEALKIPPLVSHNTYNTQHHTALTERHIEVGQHNAALHGTTQQLTAPQNLTTQSATGAHMHYSSCGRLQQHELEDTRSTISTLT